MGVKISDLTAKGSKIASTDIVEVSVDTGSSFVSRKVTGSELNELSLDTSPQLGGNLDVNGNKITSASNGNISIEPNGTGAVVIGGNSTQATELRFMEDSDNGTNYVALKADNTLAANTTYTLPTADGSSGQVLSTNGTGTLSWATAGGGLTIGTTAVTSGTIGRILFEGTGNVVQEDSALFWDNTNKRLGVGATPSTSVRLDVRAQGALSTDIAFRVRNSVDTNNIITVLGTNDVYIGSTITQAGQGHLFNIRNAGATSIPFAYFDNNNHNFDVDRFCNIKLGFGLIGANSTQSLALGLGTLPSSRNYQQTVGILTAISQGTNDSGIAMSGADTSGNNAIYTNYYGRNIVLGGTTQGTGTRKIVLNNGTAPSTNLTDAFQQYSADIVAGNAAPHFRTENGAIVKVYQETTAVAAATLVGNAGTNITDTDTFDGYTLKQIVKALRNQGLLA